MICVHVCVCVCMVDPGVDGLKRLRLTPKLFTQSTHHSFSDGGGATICQRRLLRSKFENFPEVIPPYFHPCGLLGKGTPTYAIALTVSSLSLK